MPYLGKVMHFTFSNLKKHLGIVALLSVILLFAIYFSQRYSIGFNKAKTNCLNTKVFLIDKWDKTVQHGQLIAFEMNKDTKFYPKGTTWVKKVAGVSGDVINVDHFFVKAPGKTYNLPTSYIFSKLDTSPDDLKTQWKLAEGEIFMIGETLTSFDSRFWGPINQADVKGRAYAIF